VWPRSRPHPRRYSGSGIRKTVRARRPGLRRSPRSGLALRAVGGEAAGPPTVITSEPARTTSGSRAERTPCVDIHARGERPLLAWPRSHERARRWPAARGGRAIRLSDGSGCLLPMLAAPGVPRPRLPRQPAHPAPPHRRSWSSHTSPQSYGRPSRRAKAAGLARDFGLARLRREVAAAATARHGASMAHCVHRSWDPVPHRVRSPVSRLKIMHGLHARDLVESRGSRGLV
jgi:hypothetical protein